MDGSDLSHTESESFACGPIEMVRTRVLHSIIVIIVKQIYWKGKKKSKNKLVGWLVGCFDMDAPPEFCLLPSIDARAVFFSFVGLGFVTPISPFLCVIGWILVFLCLPY